MARKRIGELLLDTGAISPTQLEAGLSAQRTTRQRLGLTLIQQGAITEAQLAKVLSGALGIPLVDLATTQAEWSAVHVIRAGFCEQHELFPYALVGDGSRGRKQLHLAMADPLNVAAIEEIEFTTGLKVVPRLATHSAVRAAILRWYHRIMPATEGVGPVEVIQRGGTIVHLERAGESKAPPRSAPGSQPAARGEEEVVILGEALPEEGAPTPEEERTALASLIAAREAARAKQRQEKAQQTKAKEEAGPLLSALAEDLDYLFGSAQDTDPLAELERKFWAMMRLMAKKGLITREEFLGELEGASAPPPRKK